MPRKKKLTLKRIKKAAIDESKKAHNQLRVITIVAYVAIFASWLFLKYDLIYLIFAIVLVMFLRIGASICLFKKISRAEQQKIPKKKIKKR